jgi:hypothetical protein
MVAHPERRCQNEYGHSPCTRYRDFERNRDISTITAIRASVRRGTDAAANVVTFASPHPVVEAKARKVGALQDDGTAADGVDCSGVVRCWLSLWDLCPC